MNNLLKIIVSIISVIAFLSSCNKKDGTPQPEIQTQSVSLNFMQTVGETPVNFTDVFSTSDGRRYTLSMFRFYISKIRLVKEDNTEQTVSGSYFLIAPSSPVCELGKVPYGNYKGLRFSVGIDSVTNHSDPTIYPASNPLAIQTPGMHWSWKSGYIFMMVEGSCDTTASKNEALINGQFNQSLIIHIGLDKFYRNVEISNASISVGDSTKSVNLKADMNRMLGEVDLKTEHSTKSFNNSSFATKVANNIPSMFSIMP